MMRISRLHNMKHRWSSQNPSTKTLQLIFTSAHHLQWVSSTVWMPIVLSTSAILLKDWKKKNKKKTTTELSETSEVSITSKKKRCSPKNRLKFNDNHWSSWPFPVHLYYLQLMECDNRTRQLNSIIQLKTRVHQHSTAGDQYSTSVTFSPNSLVFLSSPSSWNYPTISQPSLSFLPIFFPFTKKKKKKKKKNDNWTVRN